MATAPRTWLEHPAQFGTVPDAAWKPAPDDPKARALLAAAYWQHRFICAVGRERLTRYGRNKTWAALAQKAGIDEGTLGKVVNGHRPMTVALMLGIVDAWKMIELLPTPAKAAELLPPQATHTRKTPPRRAATPAAAGTPSRSPADA